MKEKTVFHSVRKLPVHENLHFTGKVEYNPDRVIHFVSLVGGVITNTYFSLGDEVNKGQLLTEIRSAELSRLHSEKRILESQITVVARQLKSVQSMHDDGIASQKDLLEAQSNVDVLNAELDKIKANLALFSASPERGVFQIRAPSSGIIVSKNVAPGMQISAEGDPLFTIADLSEVWVIVNIYAGNVMHVQEQMDVSIRTLAWPDEVFTGKITRLSQVFDSEERVLKARVVMENTDLKLKPGMLTDVSIKKLRGEDALAVPTHALLFDNNRNYLIVYRDECNIEPNEVEILSQSNGTTFIKAGIAEGDYVIIRNHLLIYEQIKNR